MVFSRDGCSFGVVQQRHDKRFGNGQYISTIVQPIFISLCRKYGLREVPGLTGKKKQAPEDNAGPLSSNHLHVEQI